MLKPDNELIASQPCLSDWRFDVHQNGLNYN